MTPFKYPTAGRNGSIGRAERLARNLADCPAAPDERAFHEDLPTLTTATLLRELRRLRLALLLWTRPDPWVVMRVARVEQELKGRNVR